MKLSIEEKRTAVAGLTVAIAESNSVVERWKYTNLRKKLEAAIRQEVMSDGREEGRQEGPQDRT